ncbi:MAG: PEP-CTERM sorting domain-containing protein [Colwellia sp.]|nr:PEP-CTERM sorting domain-containing protein [Colwellia sp.]
MLKKWMLGGILLSVSLFSQATLITAIIDSVDMEGIEVTATFGDTKQEKLTWSALSNTLGGVGNDDWSLTLDGKTFGEYDQGTGDFYGLWELTNISVSSGIVGLTIDAGIKSFYFDILYGTNLSTPGSETGREFVANDANATATFTDVFSEPDLFGTLDITNFTLNTGNTLLFLTDTDKVEVPEPSTLFIFALSLFALINFRNKHSEN